MVSTLVNVTSNILVWSRYFNTLGKIQKSLWTKWYWRRNQN